MKRLIFIISILLAFGYANAQKPLKVKNGLDTGDTIISVQEIKRLDGVTGNIQKQLDAKPDTTDYEDATNYFYTKTQTINQIDSVKATVSGIGNGIMGADSIKLDSAHKLIAYSGDSVFTFNPTIRALIPTLPTPIAYWNFNESSGTFAEQIGGYIATGTGVVYEATGHLSRAIGFDTNTDFAEVTHVTELKPQGAVMSVSLWFRLDQLPSDASRTFYLVNARHSTLSYSYTITLTSSNNINFIVRNDATTGFSASTNTNTVSVSVTWQHLVCVLQADGVMNIYLNGTNIRTSTATAFTGTLLQQDRNLVIGNSSSSSALIGAIDELRIFDVALTQSDIDDLKNNY